MSPKDRNLPGGQSALGAAAAAGAQQPVLTPLIGRPVVGASAEGHEDQEQEQRTSREHRPGRSRGGKRPPPAAADAVPTTVRFDPEESTELDFFVLELKDDAGRRTLDKSEVIREVLRLAREDEPTKRKLLKRLR
ncbi:hypothetical protein ACIBTP_41165 [Streptomyces avidinii]|uniref:hypothetical protein n=1 Tax=Streptomyces avidinii TaxID=1895 RepID=UPI00379F8FB2